MNMDIEDLVRKFVDDDHEAFAELVRRYEKKVYGVAYRMMGNHLDADDVTQEAFIRIYKNRKSIKTASFFSCLLMKIATNFAIDLIRKKKNRFVAIDDDSAASQTLKAQLVDKSLGPDEGVETTELMEHIKKAVDLLPPRQRMAIILHDIEGFSKEEIADIMECPQATVRSNLHIARIKVKKWLSKYKPL